MYINQLTAKICQLKKIHPFFTFQCTLHAASDPKKHILVLIAAHETNLQAIKVDA